MKAHKIDGETIYVISRHSNWSSRGIEKAFVQSGVYPQKSGWMRFIELALAILGVGFLAMGIIFFFAYNWSGMHRFAKLGILEALVISTVIAAVVLKQKPLVKNVLLTGASVLVGCLFAIFGQVYQTGANAYDFFLGWTIFVILWCIASGFFPLWLLFVALLNITFFLYTEQVAPNLPQGLVLTVLSALNAVATILAEKLPAKDATFRLGFTRITAFAALSFSCIGICDAIMGVADLWLLYLLLLTALLFFLGIRQSLQTKQLFYPVIIPASVIIILSVGIMQLAGQEFIGGLLLTAIFIAASVTLLIRQLLQLNKSWHGK